MTLSHTLVCGPIPAAGYTLMGDYYKIPTQMVAQTDTPSLPSQFHWVIIYGAMKRYGISESAPEVYDEGEAGWQRMMREIILTQTRRMTLPGALARSGRPSRRCGQTTTRWVAVWTW